LDTALVDSHDVSDPTTFAVNDDGSLYFIRPGDGQSEDLIRLDTSAKATQPVHTFHYADLPNQLVCDASGLYWTACNGLSGAVTALAAGSSTTSIVGLAQVGCPHALAIDASAVYWFDGHNLLRTLKDLSLTTVLATMASTFVSSIAVDATSVYWSEGSFSDPTGSISSVPINGGNVVVWAVNELGPADLAVDSTGVLYWVRLGSASVAPVVMRAEKPLEASTLFVADAPLASSSVVPVRLSVRNSSVYLLLPGSLRRIAVSDGTFLVISASDPTDGFAFLGANLYWYSAGSISRGAF
jgi:hypothetical protein